MHLLDKNESRRSLLAGLACLPVLATPALARTPARAPALPAACRWILGTWRSDVDLTMAHFTYQGQRPPPEMVARIAQKFGGMTHTFTASEMTVAEPSQGQNVQRKFAYRVGDFTPSSATLLFAGGDPPPLTLFQQGDDVYFIRAAGNFEYFRRVRE